MDIAGILAKTVAKKVACVVCDSIVPGSSLLVKGAFRTYSFLGAERMVETVEKIGLEKSLDIAGTVGEVEESLVDSILGLFIDT